MQPLVIPVVQTWGTKQHLRYAITDTTGRYWTGSGWATRQRDALLYAGHHDAAAASSIWCWGRGRPCRSPLSVICRPSRSALNSDSLEGSCGSSLVWRGVSAYSGLGLNPCYTDLRSPLSGSA